MSEVDAADASKPMPRFQFSLADIFAATVSLAYPAALVSAIDLDDLDQPEIVAVVVVIGLLLGFLLAIQYRRLWNSRSPWVVPPFLIFFWSLFLTPYSLRLEAWQGMALIGYAPIFCAVTVGMRNHKNGGRYPFIAGLGGWLLGFFLSGLFIPSFVYTRRMANERGARSSIKVLAESQEIYHRTDYDKDGTKEYARSMQDLYERTPGAADLLLIDPALVGADASLPSPQPSHGYLFRILTARGAQSFLDVNGNMIGGFAFVAYPAQYRRTGRITFLISNNGNIYEKDLGPQTEAIVKAMTTFDPDTSWTSFE